MENILVIERAIKADIPVLLEGHTGTGKTYAIMELAKKQKKTLHVINVSGELTVDSILGQQTLLDGNVLWRDGVLTAAMKKGDWVLFDEMNTALPEVLTVINGVLDDSRSVTLPNADNERVTAHAEFRFIGTQNPSTGDYAGTGRLNNALLNRMIKVDFGYMEPEKELVALKQHTSLKDASLTALVSVARYTRESNFENPISTRDLVKIVRLRDKGGLNMRDSVSLVLRDKYSGDEFQRIINRFGDLVYDIKRLMNGDDSKDPIDYIKGKLEEISKKEADIRTQKANLREDVRRELLEDLLKGDGKSGSAGVPKGF